MRLHVLIFCLLISAFTFAQLPVQTSCGPAIASCPGADSVTIGTTTVFNSSIFRGAENSGSRRQLLITRDELKAQGFINGIVKGFSVNVTSNQPKKYRNFSIRVACVDSTVTTLNQFYPASTVVFSSDSVDPQPGWYYFPFVGNGFAWDGKGGLVLETCYGNPGLSNPVEDTLAGTNVANRAWIVNVTDGSLPCSTVAGQFTFNFRPAFRLKICKSDTLAPVPVQAVCGIPSGLCEKASDSLTPSTGVFEASNSFRNTGVSGTRRQYIFSKKELVNAGFSNGIIKFISFKVKNKDTIQYRNFSISMGCGSETDSVLNGFVGVNRVVYQSPAVNPDSGWYRFELTGNGYAWAGTGALLIETCFSNPANGTKEDTLYSTAFASGFRTWGANVAGGSNGCSNGNNSFGFNARPVTRFGVCKAGVSTAIAAIEPGANGFLFPNPNQGEFRLMGIQFPLALKIRDIQGRLVMEKQVKDAQEAKIQLNRKGLYFIQVLNQGKAQNFKVLVEQ